MRETAGTPALLQARTRHEIDEAKVDDKPVYSAPRRHLHDNGVLRSARSDCRETRNEETDRGHAAEIQSQGYDEGVGS